MSRASMILTRFLIASMTKSIIQDMIIANNRKLRKEVDELTNSNFTLQEELRVLQKRLDAMQDNIPDKATVEGLSEDVRELHEAMTGGSKGLAIPSWTKLAAQVSCMIMTIGTNIQCSECCSTGRRKAVLCW